LCKTAPETITTAAGGSTLGREDEETEVQVHSEQASERIGKLWESAVLLQQSVPTSQDPLCGYAVALVFADLEMCCSV
jgi:hypothetical protein